MKSKTKFRLLIFIVAYNAEKTIQQVLARIPVSLQKDYDVEALVIDDSSKDKTFERSEFMRCSQKLPFPLTVLFNPINQGYGGNQKIGFHYAIERGFDFVALVHGDGQYAPERLPDLTLPLAQGEADAVFGSRMLSRGGAIRGGMPVYKFVGNKILTWTQNRLLRTHLSELHSGYRIYSVQALQRIPFDLNTNVFHFDTEIIIQLLIAGLRIKELPIPTYYGDEICHVNGLRYAWDVVVATVKARLQELGLFYDRKFDCAPGYTTNCHYALKLDFSSPHSAALEMIERGNRVLDLGCAGGHLASEMTRRGVRVTAVDLFPIAEGIQTERFIQQDLNEPLQVDGSEFDYVLALDIIEHLRSPETFIENLRTTLQHNQDVKVVVSTGNVGFLVTRLMLLFGQFNYGKRGILDLTHTRLFTVRSFRRLLLQGGYDVLEIRGLPAPIPLALGYGVPSGFLLALNRFFIRLSRSIFSYQILIVARPRPSLSRLLLDAVECSSTKSANIQASEERVDKNQSDAVAGKQFTIKE